MKKAADYTVIITQEKRIGTDEKCFVAKVPTLDLATEADTKSEVKKAIKDLVTFHLECLTQERETIPLEYKTTLTTVTATLPKNAQVTTS